MHPRTRFPRRRALLLALNGGLLGLLALVSVSESVEARQDGRVRGNYVAVAAGAPGAAGDVIWILDTVNREMIAVTWDPSTRAMQGISYRDLAADARVAGRGGGR